MLNISASFWIIADVGFFLDGHFPPNNSIVLLSDIGEESDALFCLTNQTECCLEEEGEPPSAWIFNNTNITNTAVYFSRGLSSLVLNIGTDINVPTGIYQCLVPDAMNISTILQIGVYGVRSEGECYGFRRDQDKVVASDLSVPNIKLVCLKRELHFKAGFVSS